MHFRVLGPLTVHGDRGIPVPVTQPRQRNVLSLFLLNPNRIVYSGQISAWLWGDNQPPAAPGAVRTHIWALRSLPGLRRRLRSRTAGYSFDVAADELDLVQFERSLDRARTAVLGGRIDIAADGLAQALGLWREPALADLPATPAARAVAARFRERYRAARAAWIEVSLALDRHHETMPHLREAVAHDPLDERSSAPLMVALYRCGRRAEALTYYQSLRATLADELGVDPATDLQRLHRQILTGDRALHDLAVNRRAAGLLPAELRSSAVG